MSGAADARDHLYRRLSALLFGGGDMSDVIHVAEYLLGRHADAPSGHDGLLPWQVRRALEAGMFVTYARPFADGRGGLPRLRCARGLSRDLRDHHDGILDRRNKVHAHTDDTPLRQVLELQDPEARAAWVRERRFEGELREQWYPPTPHGLEATVELARAQLRAILADIDAVVVQLMSLERREASDL